jgi:hypothetical protein
MPPTSNLFLVFTPFFVPRARRLLQPVLDLPFQIGTLSQFHTKGHLHKDYPKIESSKDRSQGSGKDRNRLGKKIIRARAGAMLSIN